jgi:hypothetical protein
MAKKKKKTISPQSRKAKGRIFQKEIAEYISDLTGIPWGKDKDIEPREMGQSGPDIKLYGKARKKFPYAVECKNQEKWQIPKWIRQAKENAKRGMDWLLFIRKNRMKPGIVVLPIDVFFKILKRSK